MTNWHVEKVGRDTLMSEFPIWRSADGRFLLIDWEDGTRDLYTVENGGLGLWICNCVTMADADEALKTLGSKEN